ncbi:hypothetical protein [Nocardia farcinica]|uniref:hypothetical protein n=1 Tax=Nocardia farcinica TaxID=37329 RepID=UPI00189460A3|nr:hypothetical protein [Nocardia farcinica]MBF6235034.1 hypothetical protein [Nocardia farcinica]
MASHSRSAGPVLTVTANPTVDVCLDVDRLCTEGKNRALVHSVQAGGGGINVARCLRRLAIPAARHPDCPTAYRGHRGPHSTAGRPGDPRRGRAQLRAALGERTLLIRLDRRAGAALIGAEIKSFAAAITARLACGADPAAAARYGVAAAAATVASPGTEVFQPATADKLVNEVRTEVLRRSLV